MRILGRVDNMTHDEWLKMRGKGLGGSDAAIIMGNSAFSTASELYEQKVHQTDQDFDNEAMKWGRLLEPLVANEFATFNQVQVIHFPYLIQSSEYPFMLGNLDRLVFQDDRYDHETYFSSDEDFDFSPSTRILEIKTTSQFMKKRWTQDEPPQYVIDQITHYMLATGSTHGAYVAVLIGGQQYNQFYVEYNKAYAQRLLDAERKFWEAVVDESGLPLEFFDSAIHQEDAAIPRGFVR